MHQFELTDPVLVLGYVLAQTSPELIFHIINVPRPICLLICREGLLGFPILVPLCTKLLPWAVAVLFPFCPPLSLFSHKGSCMHVSYVI